MLNQRKVQLLQVGAPGRLLVAGKIEEVLPPEHDLNESVGRLVQGRCEYIQVTTRRFKKFNE